MNTKLFPARSAGRPTLRRAVRAAGAILASAAMVIIAGCSGGATSTDGEQLTQVKIGHAASISNGPLYIAMARGYFADEGIEPHLTAFKSGADMVAPLASGELDAGTGAPGAGIFNAAGRGLGIRLVSDSGQLAEGTQFSSLLVSKALYDSGKYTSVADLKGLRLGLYADGTSTMLWFDRALASGGLARADIQPNYLSGPDQVVALANGSIDAGTPAEPFATMAIEQGAAVRVAASGDFYPGLQLSCIMYGTAFTEDKPDIAVAFMRAYLRGVADFNAAIVDGQFTGDGAEEVIDIIAEYSDIDSDLIAASYAMSVQPDGALNVDGLADDLETYRSEGLIENDDLTVEDFVDTSFAAKAAESLSNE